MFPSLAVALASGVAAAERPPPIDLWGELFQIAGYLLALVALAFLIGRLGKRLSPGVSGGMVKLLGGRNLAPGVGVRVVQVGSRFLLLGVTRESVSLLAEMREEELRGGEVPPKKEVDFS